MENPLSKSEPSPQGLVVTAESRRELARRLTRSGVQLEEAEAAATVRYRLLSLRIPHAAGVTKLWRSVSTRLLRAVGCARSQVIQADFRAYLAKKMADRIRATKAEVGLTEFTNTEFLSLMGSCILPVFDAFSDFAVMFTWAMGDELHVQWFKLLVYMRVVSGIASGLLFSRWNHIPRGKITGHILDNSIVGMLLGVLGIIPACQAYVTVLDAKSQTIADSVARRDLIHLKVLKVVDILLEALPSLALQLHVGLTLGELDWSSPNFNWVLPISVCLAILGPGGALTSVEVMGREQQRREVRRVADPNTGEVYDVSDPAAITHQDFPTIKWTQPYYRATVLWRVTQVASLALWFALSSCAFGAGALVATPFMLISFGLSTFEAAFVRSQMGDDGQELGPPMQHMIYAVTAALLHQITLASLALSFWFLEHDENDFLAYRERMLHTEEQTGANSSALFDADGGGSLDCRQGIAVPIAFAVWGTACLAGGLSLYLDPQHGWTAATKMLTAVPKLSDDAILLDWLEGRGVWSEPPKLGHEGGIMFQFSNTRRMRLHKICDRMTSSDGELLGLYHLSSRSRSVRRLTVLLPKSNRATASQRRFLQTLPEAGYSMKKMELEQSNRLGGHGTRKEFRLLKR